MTTTPEGHPAVHRNEAGTLPVRADFESVWRELLAESSAWNQADHSSYLNHWGGQAASAVASKFAGVNHIGVYLGDYASDEEVFGWYAYLEALERAGDISSVEMGPSYISPRQYGTPGWWISVRLPGHRVIETFTCRLFGAWLDKSVPERHRLMSHVALDVDRFEDVKAILTALDRDVEYLEAIAYTETDDVGHTYGHLRNNATQSVLEIVYDAAKQQHLAGMAGL